MAASLLSKQAFGQQVASTTTPASPGTPQAVAPSPIGPPLQVGMLIYPGMWTLDYIGPQAFLAGLPNTKVHTLWKTLEPVVAIQDVKMHPNMTLADCPKDLDVLFVPGGTPGTILLMQDPEVLSFLADRGSRARYVTSVCTGSLVLGAAGLLKGYKATSHWNKRDLLPLVGAIPAEGRIVEDRNRITGGGVTAGIDFGLLISARLRGDHAAKLLQLGNEYDPHPAFDSGTPAKAGLELTAELEKSLAAGHEKMRLAAVVAGKELGIT